MSNKTVNIVELKKVAEAVRSAPKHRFSMLNWDCGTSACALGWYCRDNPNSAIKIGSEGGVTCPVLGDLYWSDAISEFFGIRLEDAISMFYPRDDGKNSRKSVIARIEQFIAEHEKAAGAK